MDITHIELKPFTWIHTTGAFSSRCDLDIYKVEDRAIVVATEREDDPASGMTVSNGADILATIIMQKYRLSPETITWIEHYPEKQMDANNIYKMGKTYHRVTFDVQGNRFVSPYWEKLDNDGTEMFLNALRSDRNMARLRDA